MYAVENRHAHIVYALIKKGADVNIKNIFGYTALMIASNLGDLSSVLALIEGGADPNLQSCCGNTALMLAVKMGDISIIDLLTKPGSDLNIKNRDGKNALMLAIEYRFNEIVSKLKDIISSFDLFLVIMGIDTNIASNGLNVFGNCSFDDMIGIKEYMCNIEE
jgi:ankyrin repeat protein